MPTRAYAMGKVAYAEAVVEEAPTREPTQEVCLVQNRCSITLKAAYAVLPTHENLEVPARKEPTQPTLPCKTHTIGLRTIYCSSLLSKFHHLKKKRCSSEC